MLTTKFSKLQKKKRVQGKDQLFHLCNVQTEEDNQGLLRSLNMEMRKEVTVTFHVKCRLSKNQLEVSNKPILSQSLEW